MLVFIEANDFQLAGKPASGRVSVAYVDATGKPHRRDVGKITDGYLYVSKVKQGNKYHQWKE